MGTPRSHHRKDSQKHRRRKPETQAAAVAQGFDDHPGATDVAADDGVSGKLIASHADVRLLGRLRKREDWIIPSEARTKVPENLLRLSLPKYEIPEGESERKETTQIAAARELRMLASANADATKTEATHNLNVHRYYLGRHSHAESPEADEVATSTNEAEPIAFYEKVSLDESTAVVEELAGLGLLPLLLGLDETSES